MKVLLVDDSKVMRQVIIRTLRQAGFTGNRVIEAANGAEGLQAVHAHGPDLVLSGWHMPEVSGIDFLVRLREAGSSVPFGFITSERSPYACNLAEAAGALFILPKPVTVESLTAALAPVLSGRGARIPTTEAPGPGDYATPSSTRRGTKELHLPAAKQARDLLSALLDRDIRVGPAAPLAPGPWPADGPCTVATLVDARLHPKASLVLDLAASAWLAGAIGLVTPEIAQAVVDRGTLPESLRENLREVLNVLTAVFNVPGRTHVRLHHVDHAGDPIPPAALARALALGRRLDLEVTVTGYGTGRFAAVVATPSSPAPGDAP